MAKVNSWYGWRPDKPDHRDHAYSAPRRVVAKLGPSADLTAGCPGVYNQAELGSCTANAIGGLDEFVQMKQAVAQPEAKIVPFTPSRLMIYYNERVMEGTVSEDAGAEIRDGIKSVAVQGVCPEAMWPYLIKKFTAKPTAKCYTAAKKHQAISYMRVTQTLDQLRGCLADGYPFVFGFSVYDAFESDKVAKTGILSLPKKDEKLLGGHAIMAVGYADSRKAFLIRNSWGADWGLKGYFWMPYSYATSSSLSDDFWTIRQVEA